MARIVLNTFGSLGDLHPYLALAIELARRGHKPLIATSEIYRAKVEAEGIEFAAVGPDVGELLGATEFLNKIWDPKRGSEYLIRDYFMPAVEESWRDLGDACEGADLLVTHCIGYAGPILAELRKLRWISIALQPAILFSTRDPSVVAAAPWARHLYGLGPWFFALMLKAGRRRTDRWAEPVARLREKLGLPPGKNPVMEGQFSPYGTLALFSPHFAAAQPDWPVGTKATGFVSYDKLGEGFHGSTSSGGLEQFLAAGPPPVVFTLGSSAVMSPGSFYEESVKAVRKLHMRAVLLIGGSSFPKPADNSIYVADYVPYSELLPRAAATVHQGGIGTTAQALRSGRPMIVVPWAHDQPDNAERCRKLGMSRTINRQRYNADAAARELRQLLEDDRSNNKSRAMARNLAMEDGLKTACDALEASVSCEPIGARSKRREGWLRRLVR